MELSKRLQAVADLVSSGMVVADVGTDHGYIPIYLVSAGKNPRGIAMDINRGPLMRATEHIAQYKLTSQIETRLSDGVGALTVGECDCVIVAGMGGALTIKIMEDGETIFRSLQEFVLQPQSELSKVRQYLQTHGYQIVSENMILEDGKYYPMMKVKVGQAVLCSPLELRYGKYLLEQQNPVLKQFLEKEVQTKELILTKLKKETGEHIQNRIRQLQEELEWAKQALEVYS